jgi:hypothetical protein
MNRYTYIFIVFLTCLLPFSGFAASAGSETHKSEERIWIHLDKSAYTAGETLHYRVFSWNGLTGSNTLDGKILYFALIDFKGRSAVSWRINVKEGDISGSYVIPEFLVPGVYRMTAYTSGNMNSDLFYQQVVITSLSHAFPDSMHVSGKDPFIGTFDDKGIRIEKSGDTLHAGDTLVASLFLDEGIEKPVRISVSASLDVPFAKNDTVLKPIGEIKNKLTNPGIFFQEYQHFILSGYLKQRSTDQPIRHGQVLLAVNDSLFPHILYSRTDTFGRFNFYLDEWFDNHDLVLQSVGPPVEGGIRWEIMSKTPGLPQTPMQVFLTDDKLKSFTRIINEVRMVESVYTSALPAETRQVLATATNYFIPPSLVIRPADYADMVNLNEMIENMVPIVRLFSRNGNHVMQIYNPKTGEWPESNMVLMNGIPFYDLNFVATLGTKDISKIEVISSNYIMGDLTWPGVFSIYTRDHKIPAYYLKNKAYIFANPVSDDGAALEKSATHENGVYPDFRTCLMWEPDQQIEPGHKTVIRIPVSSLTGHYSLVVNGITGSGKPVSGKTSFDVK